MCSFTRHQSKIGRHHDIDTVSAFIDLWALGVDRRSLFLCKCCSRVRSSGQQWLPLSRGINCGALMCYSLYAGKTVKNTAQVNMGQWIGSVYVQIMLYRLIDAKPLSKPILCWVIVNFNQYTKCFIREMHLKISSAKWQRFVRGWGRRQFETPWRQWDFGGLKFPGKMIRVNCVRFNMTAADAQVAQLDIGGLWAWYDLGLNV